MDHKFALLIVDMITDFNFDDGETLFSRTKSIVSNVARFKAKCHETGIPIIYVNDNFEGEYENTESLLEKISSSEKGRFMLESIGPDESDTIFLKPQRSGFFGTDLGQFLEAKHTETLVVTGLTTDICVLFTAHDAFMRKMKVAVPSDCVTAVKDEYHNDALRFLERVAEADIHPTI
jgi:nicotinamidase-related amidase